MPRSNSKSEFAERILWPIWLWAFLAIMVGSIYLTIWAPFGHLPAIVISAVISSTLLYSNKKFALEIVLINDWLYVGNAKIEVKYLKRAIPLGKQDFLKLRGRNADPAAFNGTRFWVSTGVKVEINDKKDPTPYWLISSRKAKLLASRLN
ncbi:MAG: DUF3093 domain-containing protein [Actinobacteria bacterium]|nr:DUF3093 domain-containing protein [Actinomycetota bacterium]